MSKIEWWEGSAERHEEGLSSFCGSSLEDFGGSDMRFIPLQEARVDNDDLGITLMLQHLRIYGRSRYASTQVPFAKSHIEGFFLVSRFSVFLCFFSLGALPTRSTL